MRVNKEEEITNGTYYCLSLLLFRWNISFNYFEYANKKDIM